MGRRIDMHNAICDKLREIAPWKWDTFNFETDNVNDLVDAFATRRVYYQPSASVHLEYPCVIYKLEDMPIVHANNRPYHWDHVYQITVIDRDPESEIRELRKLKQHILDYGRTREVFAEYQRLGRPDDFLEAHRAEIQIHLAAKKAFDEYKPKRVPKLKDLNLRLSKLSARQKTQYEEYRETRKNMQRWQAIQQSIESSLNRVEKEKRRGVSR